MAKSFELHFFAAQSGYQLTETVFTSVDGEVRRCIRGKTPGAFRGSGSFQWTSAVRAISSLAIRHKLFASNRDICKQIMGGHESLASSLDYALSKAPTWLEDMFGSFVTGQLVARRMILVTNPNRKRPGPVALSLNDSFLTSEQVKIFVNACPVADPETLKGILAQVEGMPEPKAAPEQTPQEADSDTYMRLVS